MMRKILIIAFILLIIGFVLYKNAKDKKLKENIIYSIKSKAQNNYSDDFLISNAFQNTGRLQEFSLRQLKCIEFLLSKKKNELTAREYTTLNKFRIYCGVQRVPLPNVSFCLKNKRLAIREHRKENK